MNHTLLVVDDNPNNVRLLQDILEDEAFTVCTASRGDQLLELARDMRPDAILLDIMMPGIDGFEVCRILKQEYLTQDIPVLMVTAKTEGSDLKKALELGAFDFIKKPIDEVEVIARVQSALRFKEREDRLRELASKDGLTGVYNHALLIELFDKECRKQSRSGGALSFVMLDIDRFKQVNDTYGHQAGDRILKEFARIVLSSVRSTDTIGRYGGEEFGLVLPEANARQSYLLCERIREQVKDHLFSTGSEQIRITVSAGIYTSEEGTDSRPEEMIKKADHVLYRAKNNGRDRVEVYTPDEE